ncbi:toll/interleukin-1 receptor domain-containing protein [Spongiactinospora sp. TRM90649]|uniref:toll/interleukin-1 receptor domain-containing protein n=1 Tax=Spongiactinospora sp. TRM90649 TaxID=3031114 RepID=UPI0023F8F549|nr:toll/interleukin-1 receptor domain-containing protein [Spongiactinospora sp. TRM90649]MDF5753108.1 toll/interleukin-1 receptor domain-containing protein [Spongiactinospora sp. TRM90649]
MRVIPPGSSQDPSHDGFRYWAFLSYSWADKRRARALHRRLERFAVPRRVRRPLRPGGPLSRRLRPVFRDEEEMAASGVLDERLCAAVDDSAALVLLASPDSARSRYVDQEVRRFVATRGTDRLVIVAIGEGGRSRPPLPESVRGLTGEPLWIDCRDDRGVGRRALVRIAAAVLGVDFDLLWGRHRRRRRKLLAGWTALALTVAGVVGVALWQRDLAQERSPDRQTAIFRDWYARDHGVSPTDPQVRISRIDDLNDDGLLDYIMDNGALGFCGSGGCGMDVYLTKSPGRYVSVLSLLGDTTPRVRTGRDGRKEIVVTQMTVDREPLYSVYTLHGEKYELRGYEFCDGLFFERCEPTFIQDLRYQDGFAVAPDASPVQRPQAGARPIEDLRAVSLQVAGVLPGGRWYLVCGTANADSGEAGFVPASSIRH